MSTNKGCASGKSSLIGLGSARDYDGCAILQEKINFLPRDYCRECAELMLLLLGNA